MKKRLISAIVNKLIAMIKSTRDYKELVRSGNPQSSIGQMGLAIEYLQLRSRMTEERRIKESEEWREKERTGCVDEGEEALVIKGGKASQVISCSR